MISCVDISTEHSKNNEKISFDNNSAPFVNKRIDYNLVSLAPEQFNGERKYCVVSKFHQSAQYNLKKCLKLNISNLLEVLICSIPIDFLAKSRKTHN